MITNYLEYMSKLYNYLDGFIIINQAGIVEYSVMLHSETSNLENEGFTGHHILDCYPGLTEDNSTHYRVMRSGRPIFDEQQSITDINGNEFTLINSTYPIEYNKKTIGTIEGSVIISKNGKAMKRSPLPEPQLKYAATSLYTLDDIITKDKAMLEIKERIEKIAIGDSPILIYGETGTGKELIAQAIHSHSARAKGPFISQNCSAIPATLLESILFGTVKGSYTGAENRKGLFELANHGTLFLDELSSMDISLQPRILKAIEEKKLRRVGDEKETPIDVRIVSAVNQDPFKSIEEGSLRRDLFFRLGVIQINIPPLRERKEDILLLTDFFINQYNHKMKLNIVDVSDFIKNILCNYKWIGNVRELKNAIEHAFYLTKGEMITLNDLPEYILYDNKGKEEFLGKDIPTSKSLPQLVEEFERKLIINALAISKNVTDTARTLQITRQALKYKMDKYML